MYGQRGRKEKEIQMMYYIYFSGKSCKMPQNGYKRESSVVMFNMIKAEVV